MVRLISAFGFLVARLVAFAVFCGELRESLAARLSTVYPWGNLYLRSGDFQSQVREDGSAQRHFIVNSKVGAGVARIEGGIRRQTRLWAKQICRGKVFEWLQKPKPSKKSKN